MLTVERLKELLHYDPETGLFHWKVSRGYIAQPGHLAGVTNKRGYIYIGVDGRGYLAHRLAWFYMTGRWPADQIDHINQTKSDNRFSNLRECDNSQNQQNTGLRADNRSGFKGVSLHKSGRWVAERRLRGRRIHLGYHQTPEAAHAAYVASKAMEA